MTTKLPDAPQQRSPGTSFELPPDPMIAGMTTISLNYQARVNEAIIPTAGTVPDWDLRKLARAALSFESEMALLALGHDIDPHGGSPYGGTSVSLGSSDADVQVVTNVLLSVAGDIITKLQDVKGGADGVRVYVAGRAAVKRIMETIAAVL
jgi:hypothetical protein